MCSVVMWGWNTIDEASVILIHLMHTRAPSLFIWKVIVEYRYISTTEISLYMYMKISEGPGFESQLDPDFFQDLK